MLLSPLPWVWVAALVWMVLTRPGQSISDYFRPPPCRWVVEPTQSTSSSSITAALTPWVKSTVLGISALILRIAANPEQQPLLRYPAPDGHPDVANWWRVWYCHLRCWWLSFSTRGHNPPGGGFIGGLVLAIGLLLQSVAHGQLRHGQRHTVEMDCRLRLMDEVRRLSAG